MSFAGIDSRLEKDGPPFSSFNPFPSLAFVVKDDGKRVACRCPFNEGNRAEQSPFHSVIIRPMTKIAEVRVIFFKLSVL